jgi:hypothetical protein
LHNIVIVEGMKLSLIMFALALSSTACGGAPFEFAPTEAITLPGSLGDPAADAGDPVQAVDAGQPDSAPVTEPGPDSGSSVPVSADAAADSSPVDPEPDSGAGLADAHVEPDADPVHDACVLTTHTDGIGDSWVDCEPVGTMTEAEAMSACAAFKASAQLPAAGCVAYVNAILEGCGGPASAVCTGALAPTSDDQACWVYEGATTPATPGKALHVMSTACSVDGTWQ